MQGAPRDGTLTLPVPLLVSALRHLTSSRAEVAGLEKELVDLRNSRVQHVPPSAWVKREHKYKQDHEKFEHTMNMQRARIAKLEAEVAVLREGGSIKPLEQRIEVGLERPGSRAGAGAPASGAQAARVGSGRLW
jgi:hypothetical protein